ncbi:hypothetical protein AHAS_Ahas16G0126000 [Arachis hypogaea]
MTEEKIVSWVKSESDKLSKGETFYDGYIASIMIDEGGVAIVGASIALLAENVDEIEQAKFEAQSPSSASSSASSSPSASSTPAPPPRSYHKGFVIHIIKLYIFHYLSGK